MEGFLFLSVFYMDYINYIIFICVVCVLYNGVLVSTPKTRLQRLSEILKLLEDNGNMMKFKDLYGRMALAYGVTERTFWEYLEVLKSANKIDYPEIYRAEQKGEIEIKLEGIRNEAVSV